MFFNVFILTLFRNPCTAYEVFFSFVFFPPSFLMLECCQVGGVRETEAHNRTGRRQLALLHTRMAAGGGGQGKEVWTKKQTYVQPPLWTGNSSGHLMAPRHLPMPHILAAFYVFFSFISLNIQIIRTILSCQIKKIYRGSLGFFFPLPKEGMVNTFRENKQQLKIRASI